MTDQVPTEYVRFKGKSYVLLTAEPMLFSLRDHDIHPEDTESSNWAGFVAHFDINDDHLYLDYLSVGHTPAAKKRLQRSHFEDLLSPWEAAADNSIGDYVLPPLNDVEPTDAGMGHWHYQNINLALDYSGTMILDSNQSQQQPTHLKLVFEKGHLASVKTIPVPDTALWGETEGFGLVPSEDFNFDNPCSDNGKDSGSEPPKKP